MPDLHAGFAEPRQTTAALLTEFHLVGDRLLEGRGVPAVGDHADDGVVHDPQLRGLADGVAAVGEDPVAVPLVEDPADAPVGAEQLRVRHLDLRLPHRLGVLETGLGRAANVALAALPGDTSASRRYFDTDITDPFELQDGHLPVPTGPGLGVTPTPEILEKVTTSTEWIPF